MLITKKKGLTASEPIVYYYKLDVKVKLYQSVIKYLIINNENFYFLAKIIKFYYKNTNVLYKSA